MIRALLAVALFSVSACAVAQADDPARGPIRLVDESTTRGDIEVLKCVGAGVSCTRSGRTGTMTIAGADTSNMVTTDTVQTVAGAKTFSAAVTSSVSASSCAYVLPTNGRICMHGAGSSKYLYSNGFEVYSNGTFRVAGGDAVQTESAGPFYSISGKFFGRSTVTSSANAVGAHLGTDNDLTHDGAQLLVVSDNENSGSTAHFKLDKDGAPVFNFQGGASQPTCNAAHRGYLWRTQGGAGVADALEWCAKTTADAYAWVAVAVPVP